MSYGRDLWDCLSTLQENTSSKTAFMKSLKTFFISYKKALDTFSQSIAKSLQVYERDFCRSRQDTLVDTLSTAFCNVKLCLDDLHMNI